MRAASAGQLRVAPISHARRAARAHRRRARRGCARVQRRRRPRAHRARAPGRARVPQRQARHRAAVIPRRAAPPGGRAARVAGPHRGERRHRTPPHRARPARRRPAAPRRTRRQPPARARRDRRRPRAAARCSTSSTARCKTRCRSCATSRTASTRRCSWTGARRGAACGRATAARSTSVVAEGIGRYDRDVEAAVYFCCLEALQNAGKHAPEAPRRWCASGRTRAGCSSRSPTTGPASTCARAHHGHGFVNMWDRLGAIGGTVRWESAPGKGTTIAGSVPIVSPDVSRVTKAPASRPAHSRCERRRG